MIIHGLWDNMFPWLIIKICGYKICDCNNSLNEIWLYSFEVGYISWSHNRRIYNLSVSFISFVGACSPFTLCTLVNLDHKAHLVTLSCTIVVSSCYFINIISCGLFFSYSYLFV